MRLACVDLFCGAGGLTHGLMLQGVPVVAGIDIDGACEHAYEANNGGAKFYQQDVTHTSPDQIMEYFGEAEIQILAGCAPCQPFSTYAQRKREQEPESAVEGTDDVAPLADPRWSLMYEFSRLVEATTPHIVTMENVPTVTKHDVYSDFVAKLKELEYEVSEGIVDCSEYGLPQRRRRQVLLASRLGQIDLMPPGDVETGTVETAIGDLEEIPAGGASESDPFHTAAGLTDINLERIRRSEQGGTWRDWPEELRAACHRKKSGKTYPAVYGRMVAEEPSPTLTTQFYGFGSGRFGHPTQDRAISLREGAILQGFPPSYSFLPEGAQIHFKTMGRMIGNAVPVTLGEIIGRSIREHLDRVAPYGVIARAAAASASA